ncbi:sigma-70 family RNA polymerase sigma factor [Nocardia cyriacigeorgica]|uniref:Sigma-70 family RNA polymerase sigma factor n=1 Tax=Nocardia cyriacigeorgica TaxID=135487 RepID=A0ABX0CQB9_9NOCA|nr:sigma-70 family RNA polymerase sigma factor [Nocardia cyriacigeorgica]
MQQTNPRDLEQILEQLSAPGELAGDVFGERQTAVDHLLTHRGAARIACGEGGEFLQHRFDVARGTSFLSFAVPTIMGEVRRYFRDNTWSVRVPRRVKEIQLGIGPATDKLSQQLGRMPRARELAAELDVDLAEVTQALIAGNAYHSSSIDAVAGDDAENAPLPVSESLGAEEPSYRFIEDYLAVRPLIAELPEREQQVLRLRFFESLTQHQIAERLGVSQMHVSRILSRTLDHLREQALRD